MTADVVVPLVIAVLGLAGGGYAASSARRTAIETAQAAGEVAQVQQIIDSQTGLLDRYERRIAALEVDVEECHADRNRVAAAAADTERRHDEQLSHCRAEIDRLEREMRA